MIGIARLVIVLALGLVQVFDAWASPSRLSDAKSFAYQLQSFSTAELAASPFDVVVLDYSFDGTNGQALRTTDLAAIRAGRPGRKVLAYLSIGEAERYRYYFSKSWIQRKRGRCKVGRTRSAPSWLAEPNPFFCDNFKVRFWERSWRETLFTRKKGRKGYLDRILEAGFDGVYLDIIDGFRYWDKEEGNGLRPRAARDMANLVIAIARHARVTRNRPDFSVVPQNGSDILDEVSSDLANLYLETIDGIGAEDTFYFGEEDENNALDPQLSTISYLQRFVASGRPVFAIDYVTTPERISDFSTRACALGFIPQTSRRELNSLADHRLTSCP